MNTKDSKSIEKLLKLTIDTYNQKVAKARQQAVLFYTSTYSRLVLLNIMHGHYSKKYKTSEEIIKTLIVFLAAEFLLLNA